MRAFKRLLDRSLTAQAVLIFPLLVGFAALFRRHENPVWWVVQATLCTAITLGFLAAQRRRAGRATGTDARGVAELNRKLRHSEVPKAPEERATMRRLIDAELGRVERGGRWLPYWLGFMGLIAIGTLALGVSAGAWIVPLVIAIGVVGFCWWVLWARRRFIDRCHHMRSALQS
ncbi:hypothetical protein ABZ835_12045 [Streptomyces sp. NPDC047461]|uniref:hypothetical protein n=1 Tax=Streptomyces sp. NPDC047461 TaxID=3155619 RepID=UPI0033C64457